MCDLLEKLQISRTKWQRKTPKEKFDDLYGLGDKMCRLVGIRIFSDMKVYWYTASDGIMYAIYFLLVIYTIDYYTKRGEFLRGLQSTVVIGIVVTNMMMYWKSIGPHRFKLSSLMKFGGEFIYINDESSKYKAVQEKYIESLVRSQLIVVALILVSHALFSVGPIYVFLFKNAHVTPIPTELPYVDKETDLGFMINLNQQGILTFFELMATIRMELGHCFQNNVIATMPALIRVDLNDIGDSLKSNPMGLKTKVYIRNLLIKVQDFDRYIQDVIEVYYVKMFVATYLYQYSISLSIFSQLIFDFPAGYACAMLCYTQLMMLCYMGQNVKNANERIEREFYNMPWYLLPTEHKKELSYVLHRLQNGAVLTIGPFAQLGFDTGANLTRNIYRFTMLLLTIFK